MLETIQKIGPALDLFTAEAPEWGVSEAADALAAPKSSTHALLTSMASIGLLERTGGARYRLGWRLLSLSRTLIEGTPYRTAAGRAMRAAVDRCGDTMHLAVFDRGDVVYVESVRAPGAAALPTAMGTRLPAHPTGVGKVLLAHRTEEEARSIVARTGLRRFTPNTIVTRAGLWRELEQVRRAGVAFDREETIAGLCCVAAPVRGEDGEVVAAVSVSAPTARFARRESDLVELVRDVAAQGRDGTSVRSARPTISA
ncbi:MAG: transcriptional regulator, IclR family [Solirubrobacterales bacterium]|nr:transcriptional regulator, IclR family [Solirubrobacterales bacterium]